VGKLGGKFGQKLRVICFDLKKCGQIVLKSFFFEFFSGTFSVFSAKILRTPKNMPAAAPVINTVV